MSALFAKSKKRKHKHTIKETPKERSSTANDNSSDSSSLPLAAAESPTKPTTSSTSSTSLSSWATFEDLGLASPLVSTCRNLGFSKPTPVQRTIIPFLLRERSSHVLALAATGSGKTAAFCLPILHHLAQDPYGIYAVVLTPTRELAKQIHQQVLALGSSYRVQSTLVVGGMDAVRQSCELEQQKPHFVVATPGRLAELLRGPRPPRLQHVRYMVLDEADRLLVAKSGFERDVAELLLHITTRTTTATTNTMNDASSLSTTTAPPQQRRQRHDLCQTLLFSATLTKSLESIEEMAGAGLGRLPLQKFVIHEDGSEKESKKKRKREKDDTQDDSATSHLQQQDNDCSEEEEDQEDITSTVPRIPAGLKQEYVFMPSRVRDAYLLTTIRTLLINGGRRGGDGQDGRTEQSGSSGWTMTRETGSDPESEQQAMNKARSAIVFVSTCERAALVSGILSQVGVDNVALHSLLSQNRRLASLAKFKSQHVRILVATDVASRGLDIPTVDLVLNSELPRRAVDYVHRVGRTARAGRRGRAISLVAETDVSLVHAAERMSGRSLEKCTDITDEAALRMLGPVTKAARLAKMKLMDIGFDELVKKMKSRKARDRKERERTERALRKLGAHK